MTIANTSTVVGWVNADGLRVPFATQQVNQGKGGEIGGVWTSKILELDVDFNTFSGATGATVVNIIDPNAILPLGARIEAVVFAVTNPWDSTSSDVTLDFGLVKTSDYATIWDADGLVAALAKSVIDTENAIVRIDREANATYAGSALDDDEGLGFQSVVCCNWNNHAPSQGSGKLRIFYR